MNTIFNKIIDIIYPLDCRCLACGHTLYHNEHMLCDKCAAGLKPIEGRRCRVCSRRLYMEEELAEGLCGGCRHLPLERRIFGGAPFDHGETAARLVYALKYEHIIAAAEPLIPGMLNELPKGFDALVPVPLHVRRQRVRGYNQSMALCEALGRASGLPILNALRRTRATRQQMKLAADEREANVSRAFEVIKPVGGKRLIIVDDVRTTGWTILSCADELYLKGAINVRSLTATLAVIGR